MNRGARTPDFLLVCSLMKIIIPVVLEKVFLIPG